MNDNQITLTFIDEARRELAYSQTFARETPSAFARLQVTGAKARYDRCISQWRCQHYEAQEETPRRPS
jgi:hypothetical protein